MLVTTLKYLKNRPGSRYLFLKCVIVAAFFISNIYAFPELSSDYAFQFFSWTRKESDNLNYGYKLIAKVNSQKISNGSLAVDATVRVAGLPGWLELVKSSYGSLNMTFSSSKPINIIKCSPIYQNCPWLEEIKLSLDQQTSTIRLLFPIPTSQTPYHRFDYFTIAVNDSIHLQFQGVQDSIFMGSFLNNNRRNEPDKWLMAKGAIMIRTSNKVPFKIHNIELNAKFKDLINLYLGTDLSQLSTNCDYYGMDFIDASTTEHIIHVNNITVPNTKNLSTDSTYLITWVTEGKEALKNCSLYVSFDNDSQWIPIAKIPGNGEQYKWLVPNNGKSKCVLYVRAIGYEGQNSSAMSSSLGIVSNSMFKLQATAISNSSAQITWNPQFLDTINAMSLFIAYSPEKPILSYPDPSSEVTKYSFHINSDTISNLQKNAIYYFSAFVMKSDGSYVSAGPFAIDTETIIDHMPPVNNYQLTAIPDTSQIRLIWKSVSSGSKDAESIGIFMCKFRYPTSYDDKAAVLVKTFPLLNSSFSIKDIGPDQTYYFSLMVRDSSGNWAKPNERSIIRSRLFVTGGLSNVVDMNSSDTIHLFNDSLLIWNKSGLSFTDTMDYWQGPIDGFVSVSHCFAFRNGTRITKPLWAQIPYSGINATMSPVQINLYSYNVYNGGWLISMDSVIVDTVHRTISAKNSVPSLPFMFMIDTLPPKLVLLSHNDKPVKISQRINDTISVTDNIMNLKLQFFAGAGNEDPWDHSLYIWKIDTVITPNILGITFPPGVADACTGLRSFFRVSDKVHEISVNLSKPVLRENENCDNFTTVPLQWTPVIVSAQPDHPELESIMNNSCKSNNWTYDIINFRIFKWISGHSKAFAGGWVEYGNDDDSIFSIKPGVLSWIKTKNPISIDFGSAIVPQLTDTPGIIFKPGEWTDFSNPFPFDIYIGDILEVSSQKRSDNSADSLEIYSWSETKGSYQTKPIYLPAMPGLNKLYDTIKSNKPYMVYNPSKKTITFHIPPVCLPVSKQLLKSETMAKKEQCWKKWSLCINSWIAEGAALPSVYCGQNASLHKDITYYAPPSFTQQHVSVYDSQKRVKWGCIVSSQKSESGNYFEILFENSTSLPIIVHTIIGKTFGIDPAHSIQWYDPDRNLWRNSDDTLQFSLKSQQKLIQIVAVGNEQYFRDLGAVVQKNVLALRSIYPNPFTRSCVIQFSLPYHTQKVSFFVFNLLGQVLWSKDLTNLKPGPSSLIMDKQMSTGVYIFRMKVKIEGSGSPKVFDKKLICTK